MKFKRSLALILASSQLLHSLLAQRQTAMKQLLPRQQEQRQQALKQQKAAKQQPKQPAKLYWQHQTISAHSILLSIYPPNPSQTLHRNTPTLPLLFITKFSVISTQSIPRLRKKLRRHPKDTLSWRSLKLSFSNPL